MSATLARSSTCDDAVYGRLFREGRSDVLARIEHEFPHTSPEDREDVASLALLDMVRRRRLTRWEPGAIGVWAELARQRMVNELRRTKRREQRARLEPLTDDVKIAVPATPHDDIETALSDWRAVELMAQMSPRAATFVRLRVLEGGSRADVRAATGWSSKQYEKAQVAAKSALKATLTDLDSPRRCARYRRLIDRRTVGEEPSERKLAELHAHVERCGSCRTYSHEACRAVRGVAPLFGLLPASAAGGGALVGVGAIGFGVPAGVIAKGVAVSCAGVLCVGGAFFALRAGENPPSRKFRTSAPLQTSPALSTRTGNQRAVARPARPTRRGRDDSFGLHAPARALASRPAPDLDPAPVEPPNDAEAAFGLGAAERRPSGPNTSCRPGELGC